MFNKITWTSLNVPLGYLITQQFYKVHVLKRNFNPFLKSVLVTNYSRAKSTSKTLKAKSRQVIFLFSEIGKLAGFRDIVFKSAKAPGLSDRFGISFLLLFSSRSYRSDLERKKSCVKNWKRSSLNSWKKRMSCSRISKV